MFKTDTPVARETAKGRQRTEGELKALMLAGLGGDAAAHGAMLRALTPILKPFFSRRLRDNPDEAEDLVQETLIAVHARRASFERQRPFMPWLFSIARHKLVDHFRRTVRHQPIEGLEEILAIEGFERASNAALDIERLLRILPAKQARVIRETKVEELSIAEVAARAGLTASDVKVSVHRGMKALAVCLAAGESR